MHCAIGADPKASDLDAVNDVVQRQANDIFIPCFGFSYSVEYNCCTVALKLLSHVHSVKPELIRLWLSCSLSWWSWTDLLTISGSRNTNDHLATGDCPQEKATHALSWLQELPFTSLSYHDLLHDYHHYCSIIYWLKSSLMVPLYILHNRTVLRTTRWSSIHGNGQQYITIKVNHTNNYFKGPFSLYRDQFVPYMNGTVQCTQY